MLSKNVDQRDPPPEWVSLASFRVAIPHKGIMTRTILQAARARGAVALMVSGSECFSGHSQNFGECHQTTPEDEPYNQWVTLQENLSYNGYLGRLSGLYLFTDENSPYRFSLPFEIRALDARHCGVNLTLTDDPSTFTHDFFPDPCGPHQHTHHQHHHRGNGLPGGYALWNGKNTIT